VRALAFALPSLVLLSGGCLVGDLAAPGDPGDPGDGRAVRPVPTNGLVIDANLAARLPATALGTRAADGTVALAADPAAALAAPAGHQLLKYVAICALPADEELAAGGDRFPGYYGLAPEWATGACGESCQRWVSACLLAHANADGHSFPISLRGEHPALRVEPATAAAFTYQEAAYYGNVFQRQLYACAADGATHASASDAERFLNGRICGQLYGDCGLISTGFCAWSAPDLSACERPAPAGGSYADCHTGGLAEDIPRTSPVVREVITVYLQP